MESRIEWNEEFEVGNPQIDDQHRIFIDIINRIGHALLNSDDTEYQSSLFLELNAYARFHFLSEENLMKELAYPDYEKHMVEHAELLELLTNREMASGAGLANIKPTDVINFLVNWFLLHSQNDDKILADFISQ